MHAASGYLERRTSRRGFLVRAAVVGSALTVGPIRYLVRPQSAWATVQPGACAGKICAQRFSEFCCSINSGLNSCPKGTFIGGWWKAHSPTSSKICGGRARYYLDCNQIHQADCPRPPACANSSCNCRRTCLIHTSYFNWNVHRQHHSKTWIVCRIVSCTNPCKEPKDPRSRIAQANCRCKYHHEDATRYHEACCDCGQCH